MNLIERQREESRRDDEAEEEEEDEDEEEEESTVCVNIVMTVKPEWIDEVKFRESSRDSQRPSWAGMDD